MDKKIVDRSADNIRILAAAMVEKAKSEIENLIAKGKQQIGSDKEKMLAEVKAEVADLVVAVTQKVLGEALTKDVDKKVVEEAIRKIR